MGKSIERCQNCRIGNSICVFSKLDIEQLDNGFKITRIPHQHNCNIGQADDYAIYPDCDYDESGFSWRVCENIKNSEANPIGTRAYQFETLTTHQVTGDEYDLNRHDHIHPLYHMIDYNVPINTTGFLAEDEVGEMMGHNEFSLVSNRWVTDGYGEAKKAMGIDRVRFCTGMYGTFDNRLEIIRHKSMKDWWASIPWWANYTRFPPRGIKRLYNIFVTPMDDIEKYCIDTINDDTVAGRLLEAYCLIKDGSYINVGNLLTNNGLNREIKFEILNNISTTNPRNIYTSSTGTRYNVENLKKLYFAIKRNKIPMRPHLRVESMGNIANYILNDIHGLGAIEPDMLTGKIKPSKRYWYAIDIIKSAIYQDGIIKDAKSLPEWFKTLFNKHRNRIVEDPLHPEDIGPAVMTVRNICEVTDDQKEIFESFKDVCRMIQRITPGELKVTWNHWLRANKANNPKMFWTFIINVRNNVDEHNICHLSTFENGLNFADDVLNGMISDDTFEIDVPVDDNSPYWQVKSIGTQRTSESYELTYNRPYYAYYAAKKNIHLEIPGSGLELDQDANPRDLEDSEEFDYVDQMMYDPNESGEETIPGINTDMFIDDEFLHLPSIESIQKEAEDG